MTAVQFGKLKIKSLDAYEKRAIDGETFNQEELADVLDAFGGPIPPVLRGYIANLVRKASKKKGRPKIPECDKRIRAMLLRHRYRVCKRYVRRFGKPPNLPPEPVKGEAFYHARSQSELAAMMVANFHLGCPTRYKTVQNIASSQKIT